MEKNCQVKKKKKNFISTSKVDGKKIFENIAIEKNSFYQEKQRAWECKEIMIFRNG